MYKYKSIEIWFLIKIRTFFSPIINNHQSVHYILYVNTAT